MRILHIAPYYAPAYAFGGVVSAVEGLASAQAARGDSVTVLTTDAGDLAGGRIVPMRDVRDGVQVIRCRNVFSKLRARYNLSTPRKFAGIVRDLAAKCDVIHLHELRTIEALLTVRYAPPQARIVLSPHGTLSYATGRSGFKRAWDRLLGRQIMMRVNAVSALTQVEAAEVGDLWAQFGLTPTAIDIVPNGVGRDVWMGLDDIQPDEKAQWLTAIGVNTSQPTALFMGRLHERKGVHLLIPAFGKASQVAEDQSRVQHGTLIIAGADSGMLANLSKLMNELADSGKQNIHIVGMLTGRERLIALAVSQIFVLPAIGEGLPMAALEAAAAGCALILTEGCNLPETAEIGAGIIVPRTIEGIASALRDLMVDTEKRKAMGERARQWASDNFRWEKIIWQMDHTYGR